MLTRTLVVALAVAVVVVALAFAQAGPLRSGEDEPAWKQKQTECNNTAGMRWFEGECMAAKPFCRARGKWWYKDRCNDTYDAAAVASGGGGTSDWAAEKARCEKRQKRWFQSTCMTGGQFCRARGKVWNMDKKRCDNAPGQEGGQEQPEGMAE